VAHKPLSLKGERGETMSPQRPLSQALSIELGTGEERKRRLFNILAGSGVVTCIVIIAAMLTPPISPWTSFAAFGFLLIVGLVSLALNRKRYSQRAALAWLSSLILAIFLILLEEVIVDQEIAPPIYWFAVIVFASGTILKPRATFVFATVSAVLIGVLALIAFQVGPSQDEAYTRDVIGLSVPPAIVCYVVAIISWLYSTSLEKALRQITDYSAELERANQEIRAFSQTLEEKVEARTRELREFVSMVAHELRGPLTVIRGYTELLQEGKQREPEPRSGNPAALIASNTEQMLSLTDDLLEISRLRSGGVQFRMEPLAIEAVIEEVCTSYGSRIAEKHLGLRIDLPPDLPKVQADHLYLNHVLRNLVSNAYRYTPAGAIVVSAQAVDGFVEVSVSDTGVGIPPEEQEHLFHQFIRGGHEVVRSQKGTGLGLSIAHSIVEAHGGEIYVESEVDNGSIFRFTIPTAA
jgi:signal transduction histidine kinase